MKKILKIFVIVTLIVISLVQVTYATEVEFKVWDKEGQTKQLEEKQGYISKSVVDTDLEKGEVVIELKISNTTKKPEKKRAEIVFLVDNSGSMAEKVGNTSTSKKQTVTTAMRRLINKIYDQSPNVYMGIVKFSENTNTICSLTNQKESVLNAVNSFGNTRVETNTELAKGLSAANSLFTSSCENKILVLLTDGISNVDSSKSALINVKNSGTYPISMITGINDNASVSKIFGTTKKPTAGKLYSIEDTDINEIVSDKIFYDIMEKIPESMHNVVLEDYFPQEIIDNFEFSYVNKPTHGTISTNIDEKNKKVVWNITKIEPEEVATVRYSLKIKNKDNEKLYNKIIPTNEKVEITYIDYKDQKHNAELEKSPKVELVVEFLDINGSETTGELVKVEKPKQEEIQEKIPQEEKKKETKQEIPVKKEDKTTSQKILPKTGEMHGIVLILLGLIVAIYGFYKKAKNVGKDIKIIKIK